MSVMRLAAKFTVRRRKARGAASQISGSGGPSPNGCGVASNSGSGGRTAAVKLLLMGRLLQRPSQNAYQPCAPPVPPVFAGPYQVSIPLAFIALLTTSGMDAA